MQERTFSSCRGCVLVVLVASVPPDRVLPHHMDIYLVTPDAK